MSAKIFGCRVDNNIGAKRERACLNRRSIGVVDDGARANTLGNCADGGDVNQAHIRVCWCFEVNDFCLITDGILQSDGVCQVNMGDLDAEPGQPVAHKGEGAAIKRLVGDHLVAFLQEAPHHRRDRAHARGHRNGCCAVFQRRHAVFQQFDGRV